jgi:hypothetical protein
MVLLPLIAKKLDCINLNEKGCGTTYRNSA